MEPREILRRLRAGETVRRISREFGVARNIVAKHARWARRIGLLGAARLADLNEIAELRAQNGVREIVRSAIVTLSVSSFASSSALKSRAYAQQLQDGHIQSWTGRGFR